MSKPVPVACPKCRGQVTIHTSSGGRGTNDLTSYCADCENCGMLIDHLSDTGRRDSAVRDYNRWARAYGAPTAAPSITVCAGYGAYDGGAALAASRSAAHAPTPLTRKRIKYLVSGYCMVPMLAEIEVEADIPAQAMKIAKAEWTRDHRTLLVSGSEDEGSASDWRPTAVPARSTKCFHRLIRRSEGKRHERTKFADSMGRAFRVAYGAEP